MIVCYNYIKWKIILIKEEVNYKIKMLQLLKDFNQLHYKESQF